MKYRIACALLAATLGSAQASSIITLGEPEAGAAVEHVDNAPRSVSIIALGEPESAEKNDGAKLTEKKQHRRPGSLPAVFRGGVDTPAISQASSKPAPARPVATPAPSEAASQPPAPVQVPL